MLKIVEVTTLSHYTSCLQTSFYILEYQTKDFTTKFTHRSIAAIFTTPVALFVHKIIIGDVIILSHITKCHTRIS